MLIGMVTRLVAHKGIDLVQYVLEELMTTEHRRWWCSASGDYIYESFFHGDAGQVSRHSVRLRIGFIPDAGAQDLRGRGHAS